MATPHPTPAAGGDRVSPPGGHALLCRNWWAVALRGAAALVFGFLAVLMPGITLVTLVILLSAYFLVDGIFAIVAAVRAAQRDERWWPFLLEGVVDIAAGIVVFLWPQISILALMYLLAIWAIFTGVLMLFGGTRIGVGMPRWLLVVGGVLSILLGVVMIAQPALGLLALVWWVGLYLVAFGVVMLALGLWLRAQRGQVSPAAA